MAEFIVLLGPPGAGKGTQASLIAEKLGLKHISSGNIFRENIDNRTELGMRAQTYTEKGQLVPDDITIAMVEARLDEEDCHKGAVLDGFPRTVAQAKALKKMLAKNKNKVQCAAFINVPGAVLVERLSGRWTCATEEHVYHLKFNPPKQPGICDVDGSSLHQRVDDKKETVEKRIKEYEQKTAPLIQFFREEGLLYEVDGTNPIDLVTEEIMKTIEKTRSQSGRKKNLQV